MPVEQFAALICAWLVSYFAHSTILLGGAWLATRKMPSRFDRVSELVWRLALGIPVVTAVVQELLRVSTANAVNSTALEYAPAAMTVSAVPTFVWITVASAWVLTMAVGLMQLAVVYRSLQRTISDRVPLGPAESAPIASLDIGTTQLSVAENLSVPLALTREVCLPRWVVQRMKPDELRAVVAHELAHVRRRDALSRQLAAVLCRVFFFQPLNWVANTRLRELSECICDEEAIDATRSTLPLASALRTVAGRSLHRSTHMSVVPAMDAAHGFTVRRVTRILSGSRSAHAKLALEWLVALTSAITLIGFVAAPRLALPAIAFQRYTIKASDPAGSFTLTIEKGRVVGATLAGHPLEREQVIQHGSSLHILGATTGGFSLQLTPSGGIHWTARKRGG